MNQPRDKGLNGNEKIEQAVAALQQEPIIAEVGLSISRMPGPPRGPS
jgi:hypothetical protein